jgi:hypothetical protein
MCCLIDIFISHWIALSPLSVNSTNQAAAKVNALKKLAKILEIVTFASKKYPRDLFVREPHVRNVLYSEIDDI